MSPYWLLYREKVKGGPHYWAKIKPATPLTTHPFTDLPIGEKIPDLYFKGTVSPDFTNYFMGTFWRDL